MFRTIHKRMKGEKGFTLIELLVVIIIIAILAAIAIPTFLGQRQKAQDAAAKSLVRNAMMAVESAYTDTRDFSSITDTMLGDIEPSITFVVIETGAASAATADAQANSVNVSLTGENTYEVGSLSQSETEFGVAVNKGADGGNVFYKGGEALASGAAW
jgi:type IV pilus assembly protein PilA